MTYNRDMQEDKEPVFDSVDTIKAALAVFAGMLAGMRVNPDAVRRRRRRPECSSRPTSPITS